MLSFDTVRHDPEIRAWIEAGNDALGAMRYTEHGFAHAGVTAEAAAAILTTLGYEPRLCELARIAGFIHDIGNAVNRVGHAMSGALLAADILRRLGMEPAEVVAVATAIGNHDEQTAAVVSPLSAALILADKSDVRRSRVRAADENADFDIHDRVNYAAVASELKVHRESGILTLKIRIDTAICAVMDYFEIFLNRMLLCRAAAAYLGLSFELMINETRML